MNVVVELEFLEIEKILKDYCRANGVEPKSITWLCSEPASVQIKGEVTAMVIPGKPRQEERFVGRSELEDIFRRREVGKEPSR